MKKNFPNALLEAFLYNSPHYQIRRMQQMVPYRLKDVSNISDETYMDNFIFQVHCQYLVSSEYLHTRSKQMRTVNDKLFVQQMQNMLALRQHGAMQRKDELESKLIASIKKLHEQRDPIINYLEAEELVATLDSQSAAKHKKYLVYIYKWILNQNSKERIGYEDMRQSLKTTVVSKIYEAHSKAEERKIIEVELKKYQRLAEARTCIAQGNLDQAKASYEQIFEDQTNDPNARMEALEYLCKNSQEKGDESYLLGMITKLKEEKGEERHRKYVENVLSQLTRSSSKNDSTQRKQQ